MAWQASWLDDAVFWYRKGVSCQEAWLDAALNIEEALVSDSPLFGGVFDIFKNFDSLPWDIILESASALGLPQRIMTLLRWSYSHTRRAFKIGKHIGDMWFSYNGIPQGCPLSVVMQNCYGHLWACLMRSTGVSARCFADNFDLQHPTPSRLQEAFDVTAAFVQLSGQLVEV